MGCVYGVCLLGQCDADGLWHIGTKNVVKPSSRMYVSVSQLKLKFPEWSIRLVRFTWLCFQARWMASRCSRPYVISGTCSSLGGVGNF